MRPPGKRQEATAMFALSLAASAQKEGARRYHGRQITMRAVPSE